MLKQFSIGWISIVIAIVFCVSCDDEKRSCYTYESVSVEDWDRSQEIAIEIDTLTDSEEYFVKIGTRTTLEYPYRYLWLRVRLELENPAYSMVDTLKCSITDAKGNRNGGGLSLCEEHFPWRKVQMSKGQYGKIYIRHIMRSTPLPGVSDVGAVMEKIN